MYRDGLTPFEAEGNEDIPAIDERVFKSALRKIFRREGFTAEMLAEPKVRALVDAYAGAYEGAIAPSLESGVIPEAMARKLKEDIFVFSGFKTYQGLREASRLLRDEDGTVKPFNRFTTI